MDSSNTTMAQPAPTTSRDITQILPREILREILEFYIHSASTRQVLNLRIICQKWREITDISPYWRALANKYITGIYPISCPITSYQTFCENLKNFAIPVHDWIKITNFTKTISGQQIYCDDTALALEADQMYMVNRRTDTTRLQLTRFTIISGESSSYTMLYIFHKEENSLSYICTVISTNSIITIAQNRDILSVYVSNNFRLAAAKISDNYQLALRCNVNSILESKI